MRRQVLNCRQSPATFSMVPRTGTAVAVADIQPCWTFEQRPRPSPQPERIRCTAAGKRDTGPGIVCGLLHLAARRPRTRVVVFPSDHYMGNASIFRAQVERATLLVDRLPATIALLGVRPTHPDPALGYIEPGPPLVVPGLESPAAYEVAAFHEKPSVELAATLQRTGGLWNSVVMAFHASRLFALLRQWRGADLELLRGVLRSGAGYENVPRGTSRRTSSPESRISWRSCRSKGARGATGERPRRSSRRSLRSATREDRQA